MQCCLLLLLPVSLAIQTTNWKLTYNPYFTVGEVDAVLGAYNESADTDSLVFTSSHESTVSPIMATFLSTRNLDCDVAQTHPGNWTNSSLHIMNFSVSVVQSFPSYLVTQIQGYARPPYLLQIRYRYLLVTQDCPMMTTHMVIEYLTFTNNMTNISTNLPTTYVQGNNLKYFHGFVCGQAYPNGSSFAIGVNSVTTQNSTLESILATSNDVAASNFSLTFLLIVYDDTSILADFPRMPLNTDTTGPTSVLYLDFSLGVNREELLSNIIYGMTYFSANLMYNSVGGLLSNLHANLRYFTDASITNQNNRFEAVHYATSPIQFAYGFVTFPYYGCPNKYSIIDGVAQLCSDSCALDEFYNQTTEVCESCMTGCLNCTRYQYCYTCGSSYERVDYQCVSAGNSTSTGNLVCDNDCETCYKISSNCTSCNATSYLYAENCWPCNGTFSNCQTCTIDACLTCTSGAFTLVNSTHCNPACADTDCLICDSGNASVCLRCVNPEDYIDADGVCQSECGDGAIRKNKECDDANLIDRDGCSSSCKIETDYNCYSAINSQGINTTTYCAYTKSINFTVVTVVKVPTSNRIRIQISIEPYLQTLWRQYSNFNDYVQVVSHPYQNMEAVFTSSSAGTTVSSSKQIETAESNYEANSLMTVTFDYTAPLEGQTIVLGFNFTESPQVKLRQIPSYYVRVSSETDNNMYTYTYSSNIYQLYNNMVLLYQLLAYLVVGQFILSYFLGGKRITSEMVMVLQLAYAGMVGVQKMNPLQQALLQIAPVNNIYNILYSSGDPPAEDEHLPVRIRGMDMYSKFVYNFNAAVILLIVPAVVGLVVFILGKCAQSEHKRMTYKAFAKRLTGEFMYAGLVFSGCYVSGCAVVQLRFAEMGGGMTMIGLTLIALYGILFVLYGVLRVKMTSGFGEYCKNSALPEKCSVIVQLLFFYCGVLTGCGLFLGYSFDFINLICCMPSLVLLPVVTCCKIYKRGIDTLRTQVNLASILLVQLVYVYYSVESSTYYSEDDDTIALGPVTIALVLTLNVIINSTLLVYEAVQNIKHLFIKEEDQQQEEEKEQFKSVSKHDRFSEFSSLQSPINLASCHAETPLNPLQCIVPQPQPYRKGFIEQSEQLSFDQDVKEQLRLHLKLKEHLKSEIEKSSKDMHKLLSVEREYYRATQINYTLRGEFDRI